MPKGQEEDVESEDADVLRERQRVLSGEAGFEMLILDELTKVCNILNETDRPLDR